MPDESPPANGSVAVSPRPASFTTAPNPTVPTSFIWMELPDHVIGPGRPRPRRQPPRVVRVLAPDSPISIRRPQPRPRRSPKPFPSPSRRLPSSTSCSRCDPGQPARRDPQPDSAWTDPRHRAPEVRCVTFDYHVATELHVYRRTQTASASTASYTNNTVDSSIAARARLVRTPRRRLPHGLAGQPRPRATYAASRATSPACRERSRRVDVRR